MEQLCQDMYVVVEWFDVGEGVINLNFEDEIFEFWNLIDV